MTLRFHRTLREQKPNRASERQVPVLCSSQISYEVHRDELERVHQRSRSDYLPSQRSGLPGRRAPRRCSQDRQQRPDHTSKHGTTCLRAVHESARISWPSAISPEPREMPVFDLTTLNFSASSFEPCLTTENTKPPFTPLKNAWASSKAFSAF